MSSIQRMPTATPTSASNIPFYDPQNGRDSKASLSDIAAVLQGLLTPLGGMLTQYAAPSATGYNITVDPATDGASTWLQITPGGAYAAGTVTLPPKAECVDGQEILVTSTLTLTALTVAGNGAGVFGAPTTLTAAAPFRLRFEGVLGNWHRAG